MKIAQKSLLRIEKMLKYDKERISQPLLNLLKSDIFSVFDSYFEKKFLGEGTQQRKAKRAGLPYTDKSLQSLLNMA